MGRNFFKFHISLIIPTQDEIYLCSAVEMDKEKDQEEETTGLEFIEIKGLTKDIQSGKSNDNFYSLFYSTCYVYK